MEYLDKKFASRQPIFKNYIQNNSSIMRKDLQRDKLSGMFRGEAREDMLRTMRSTSLAGPMGSVQQANLEKIKPVQTVTRLLRLTNH